MYEFINAYFFISVKLALFLRSKYSTGMFKFISPAFVSVLIKYLSKNYSDFILFWRKLIFSTN